MKRVFSVDWAKFFRNGFLFGATWPAVHGLIDHHLGIRELDGDLRIMSMIASAVVGLILFQIVRERDKKPFSYGIYPGTIEVTGEVICSHPQNYSNTAPKQEKT